MKATTTRVVHMILVLLTFASILDWGLALVGGLLVAAGLGLLIAQRRGWMTTELENSSEAYPPVRGGMDEDEGT